MAGSTPADDVPHLGADVPVEPGVQVGEDQYVETVKSI